MEASIYLKRGKSYTYSKHPVKPSYLLHVSFPDLESGVQKIQRDFLWGGGNLEKKPHLVKWAMVCIDKKVGGLGVRGLHKLNKALLGKWIWRFANERNPLWREAIRRKFGELQGGWCLGECRNSFGTSLWKEIRKGWEVVLLNA